VHSFRYRWKRLNVFANDPEYTPVDFTRSDFRQSGDEFLANGHSKRGEFLDNFAILFFSSFEFLPSRVGGGPYIPDKSDHIESRWVVGVPEKFHESMHNASCDFRKFDGSDVYRLNKELAVF